MYKMIAAIVIGVMLIAGQADAKGASFSSGGGSRSYSSGSSSRSYSSPSPSSSGSSRSFSKPSSGNSGGFSSPKSSEPNRVFSKPSNPVNTSTVRTSNVYTSSRTHWRTRDEYYTYRRDRYAYLGWQPRPYFYYGPSSFGMWDSVFLWMILENSQQQSWSQFAYSHANDPDYIQWRQQAEKQAKTDAEIRNKLVVLDAEIAKLQAAKAPIDPDALPKDVDGAVALAPEVVTQAVDEEDKENNPGPSLGVLISIVMGLLIVGGLCIVLFMNTSRRKKS